MKMLILEKHEIIDWWHKLESYFQTFIDRTNGRENKQILFNKIYQGERSVILVLEGEIVRAVLMVVVNDYELVRECRLIMCAGDKPQDWLHLLEDLKEFVKSIGCTKLVAECRPGWEKILEPVGLKKTHVYLEMDI